ncbi:MAG: hypothetical protein ACI4OT_04020 [Bacilli bacterium]
MNKEVLNMYIDLIVVLVIFIICLIWFKRFSTFIYFFAIVDILFRLLNFLVNNVNIPFVSSFVNTYIPSSIPGLIGKYTNGVFETILLWVVFVLYVLFEYEIIAFFAKKKK